MEKNKKIGKKVNFIKELRKKKLFSFKISFIASKIGWKKPKNLILLGPTRHCE